MCKLKCVVNVLLLDLVEIVNVLLNKWKIVFSVGLGVFVLLMNCVVKLELEVFVLVVLVIFKSGGNVLVVIV